MPSLRLPRRSLHWTLALLLVLACGSAAAAFAWTGERRGPEAEARSAVAPLPAPAPGCDRRIQSTAFFVADGRGRPLAALNADRRRQVASITKLMTARLVLEAGSLGRRVTVPALGLRPDESRAGLTTGERLDRLALLRLLLVPSANDAAETLAAAGGGRTGFVAAMNRAARRLGLTRTSYANSSGMPDPGQRSTARDSVRLARLAMTDARLRAIVRLRSVRLGGRTLAATNTLLGRVRGLDGVKTGSLNANFNIVASATGRGGRVYVSVLGAPTEAARDRDAHCLLTLGRRLVAPRA